MPLDPYAELRVERSAKASDIKKAYRRRIREVHPDRHPDDAHASAKAQQVQEAYEILSDPARRDAYDRAGDTERPPDYTALARELLVAEIRDLVLRSVSQKLVTEMVRRVRLLIDNAESQVRVVSLGNVRLRAMQNRFRCRGGDNFLGAALETMIEQNSVGIAQLDRQARVAARALELLADFEDVDLVALGRIPDGTTSDVVYSW